MNGVVSSYTNVDYKLSGTVEGLLTDTSSQYTTEQTVSGNVIDDHDASGQADSLGSLFSCLSISGQSTDGTLHTWLLSRNGSISEDNKVLSSTSSIDIQGKYGVLTLLPDGRLAGIDVSTITSKETFSYSLIDKDNTSSSASLTIDLHPMITGSVNLHGSAYDDSFVAGIGSDSLVYDVLSDDNTGGNGHDTWQDFSMDQGDSIDISSLLIGRDGQQQSLGNYLSVTQTANGETVVSIDHDVHNISHYNDTVLLTLDSVKVSLEELINQQHIH